MTRVSMPSEVREALISWPGPVAVALEVNGESALVVKIDRSDAQSWQRPRTPVLYRPELGLYPTGAVFRLYLEVRDLPGAPYAMESWLNPADPLEIALLRGLTQQATLSIHVFDLSMTYVFTKTVTVNPATHADLTRMIDQALEYVASIPAAQRNYSAARDAMLTDRPI